MPNRISRIRDREPATFKRNTLLGNVIPRISFVFLLTRESLGHSWEQRSFPSSTTSSNVRIAAGKSGRARDEAKQI